MWFNKLTVPLSNDTREIEVVQLFEVRWQSRYGVYSNETRPEVEVFTSKKDAVVFRESLLAAFRLTRMTSPLEKAVVLSSFWKDKDRRELLYS